MILIRVDLPDPFSPSSACTSPGRTSNETSSSAQTPGKNLLTFRNVRAGSPEGGTSEEAVGFCCVMRRTPGERSDREKRVPSSLIGQGSQGGGRQKSACNLHAFA